MRRWQLLILVLGLLVASGLCALHEACYLPSLFTSQPKQLFPIAEFKDFERTADGKPICPRCGRTKHVRQYQYGLTREAGPEGTVSGGCGVGPESPEYKCLRCGTNFGESSFYKRFHEPNKAVE